MGNYAETDLNDIAETFTALLKCKATAQGRSRGGADGTKHTGMKTRIIGLARLPFACHDREDVNRVGHISEDVCG